MRSYRIIEPIGLIVSFISLIFSFVFFTRDTAEPAGSFVAALLTAFLVWVTYVLLRWVILAMKRP